MSEQKSGAEIRLEGIAKRYGAVAAVKPLDLVIEGGSLVTLLGPSGCGKTTLLRLIAGLEQASAGRIFIGGKDVTLQPAGARNVSMVFQSYALFPHMSVLENVCYGLLASGMKRAQAREVAEESLTTVGLAGFGARLPSEMSGGQQQRVALARALVLRPDVLLFDEPLSNLDARLRRSMREEIRALQRKLGVTVVYVTHDQSEAMAVSDKIVVMRDAEIAQIGGPAELYSGPDTVFVASFMGEANVVKGRIEAVNGVIARVRLADLILDLPARGMASGDVDVVIRPEAVRFGADSSGVAGVIVKSTYMGSHTEYTVDTTLGSLFALETDRGQRKAPGDLVNVGFAPDGVILVRP
jgi:iron(III) transport system ATP-binding protein